MVPTQNLLALITYWCGSVSPLYRNVWVLYCFEKYAFSRSHDCNCLTGEGCPLDFGGPFALPIETTFSQSYLLLGVVRSTRSDHYHDIMYLFFSFLKKIWTLLIGSLPIIFRFLEQLSFISVSKKIEGNFKLTRRSSWETRIHHQLCCLRRRGSRKLSITNTKMHENDVDLDSVFVKSQSSLWSLIVESQRNIIEFVTKPAIH